MAFRLLTVLFLAAAVAGCASSGSKPAPAAPQPAAEQSGRYMSAGSYNERNAPPLEENRPINAQDCTKEINMQAGNLMCQ